MEEILNELKFFRKTAIATDYVYVKIKATLVFLFLQFIQFLFWQKALSQKESIFFNCRTVSTWMAAMQASMCFPSCHLPSLGETALEVMFHISHLMHELVLEISLTLFFYSYHNCKFLYFMIKRYEQ